MAMKPAPRQAEAAPQTAVAVETRAAAVNDPEDSPSNLGAKASEDGSERVYDQELVRRIQSGEEAAFKEIFEKYHRRAYAVALGVVKNPQDALDIVQDAFVKVHRHIHNFQGTASFYTWLYRIVMNLSIDHIRRHKKIRDVDYDDGIGRDDSIAGDGSLLPRILGGNPGKTVLRKELTGAIQAALADLPDYHRAVILMREVEGLSYEEMADILKVPKGTIMSRLFHARRKMQASLAAYLEGDLHIED